MFRQKFFLTIALLFMVTLAFGATDPVVDELNTLLNAYQTYQANFTQETYMEGGGPAQKSSGRVMMMRPGKFRWETNQPTQQIVIANGDTLWIYDVDLQQATRQTIATQGGVNPAALLTGDVPTLIKQFAITKIKRQGAVWFQLTPKSTDNSFTLVQMQFRQGELVNIRVKNNLGQTSRFHFTGVRLNAHLNPKLFIFTPPKGVDVLKQ